MGGRGLFMEETMPYQPEPEKTILEFRDMIALRKPKEIGNLDRILKVVVPHLGGPIHDVDLGEDSSQQSWQVAAMSPVNRLFDCFSEDRKSWAARLIEVCPELESVKAFRRDYRRCLVRCLKFACDTHFITSSRFGITDEWAVARRELVDRVPHTLASAQQLLDDGIKEVHGHQLPSSNPEHIRTVYQLVIANFTGMARHMVKLGVDTPEAVKPEHIYGRADSWYRACTVVNVKASYYHARTGWQILNHAFPEWNLAPWPRPSDEREFILRESYPLVETMLKGIFTNSGLAEASIEDIKVDIRRYLGYLQNILGLDLEGYCRSLAAPEDLAITLFPGFPPTRDGKDPDPEAEMRRIFDDPEYREEQIGKIYRVIKQHETQGACRINPFVESFINWNCQRGTAKNALIYLSRIRIVGRRYLKVNSSQYEWWETIKLRTRRIADKLPPSRYKERKEIASLDDELWLKLTAARPKMTAMTQAARRAMEAETDPVRKRKRAMSYAVAVRNELLMGLLLGFHLRTKNLEQMKIGTDIFPDQYLIRIPGNRAKVNSAGITKRFFDSGPYADLKDLLDTYLDEARPILLGDRPDTLYLFLTRPVSKNRPANDALETSGMSRYYLGYLVRSISRKVFSDILPEGLDYFGTHIVRDIANNYIFPRAGEVTASQALGNTPKTARENYLGSKQGKDIDIRPFIEGMLITQKPRRKLSQRGRREVLRDLLERGKSGQLGNAELDRVLEELS